MSLIDELTSGIIKCLEEDRKFNFTKKLCDHVYEKKINLEKIITTIGSKLTSPDRIERLKAIDFLYNLVYNIRPNGFSELEVHYLTEFFINKLSDSFLIPCEVSETLVLLVTKWKIDEKLITLLCETIFKNVDMSQQNTEVRFHFYKILGNFLKFNLNLIKDLEIQFIYGFLQCVQGEKDPRCLILIFDLFVYLNLNLDTNTCEEELFDVVACYFPVMYNPPKEKNELKISRELLAERLNLCLSSNEKFIPFLIPLLLEKFESPLEQVKSNCYQLLSSILVYESYKIFAKYMNEFWNIIKFDCLKKKNKMDLNFISIQDSFKALTITYSKDEELIKKWFKMIINDLEASLFNLELNCYLSSTLCLSVMNSVYLKFNCPISRLIIANSIKNYETNQDFKRRIESLQSLYIFLTEFDNIQSLNVDEEDDLNLNLSLLSKVSQEKVSYLDKHNSQKSLYTFVIDYLNNLLGENISNLNEEEIINCLICLKKILLLNKLKFEKSVYEKNLSLILTLLLKNQSEKVLKELFLFIRNFDESEPDLIQNIIMSKLLEIYENKIDNNLIEIFKFCSLNENQEKKFLKLSSDYFKNFNDKSDLVFEILFGHIESNKKYVNTIIFNDLFKQLVDLVLQSIIKKNIFLANQENLFELITLIIRNLDQNKSKEVQKFFFNIFLDKNADLNFLKIDETKLLNNKNLLFYNLLESVIKGLKFCNDDKKENEMVYLKLFDVLLNCDYSLHETILRLIEICTAKFNEEKIYLNKLQILNESYENQNAHTRYLLIRFYSSTLKCFFLINNNHYDAILNKFIQIISIEKSLFLCKQALIGIKNIHEPSHHLKEEYHVNCKSFINQRFYYSTYSLLLENYYKLDTQDNLIEFEDDEKNGINEIKEKKIIQSRVKRPKLLKKDSESQVVKLVNNIEIKIASSSIDEDIIDAKNDFQNLKNSKKSVDVNLLSLRRNLISTAILLQIIYLPKSVIESEIKKLKSIIVENFFFLDLLSDSNELSCNRIEFLKILLEFNPLLVEDKISSIIDFTTTTLNSTNLNMLIKSKSIQCLELIAIKLDSKLLLNYKQIVINSLKNILDHKKRFLRYAAVNSINKWIVIGQPS